jgi:hypothetical protein
VQSRQPNLDDFERMSYMSRGSIRSKASKVDPKFGNGSPGQLKKPLVFIDVNLGKEKGKQKLIVYETDSPTQVAKKFGELHGKQTIVS